VIATAETVYVPVDARTLTKLPLPVAFRAALQDARQAATDHAACEPRLAADCDARA